MKLYAKVAPGPLEDILGGKKTEEFRQIESIVLMNQDGNHVAEYDVKRVTNSPPICVLNELEKYGLEEHYDEDLPAMRIFLGELIKIRPGLAMASTNKERDR